MKTTPTKAERLALPVRLVDRTGPGRPRKQTSVLSRLDDLSLALRIRWWPQEEQGVPGFGFILVLVAVVVLVLLAVVGSRANNCLSGVCSALG